MKTWKLSQVSPHLSKKQKVRAILTIGAKIVPDGEEPSVDFSSCKGVHIRQDPFFPKHWMAYWICPSGHRVEVQL